MNVLYILSPCSVLSGLSAGEWAGPKKSHEEKCPKGEGNDEAL